MKKPSIDAIRRFKEQQERKKAEEQSRKVQDKLSILEHRAAQGDRKAKSELKTIEKAKEGKIKRAESDDYDKRDTKQLNGFVRNRAAQVGGKGNIKRKPKVAETDFEELMRLAAGNNNQIRKDGVKKPMPSSSERVPTIASKPRDKPTGSDRMLASSSKTQNPPPATLHRSTARAPQTFQTKSAGPSQGHKPQSAPTRQILPSSSSQRRPEVIRRPPVISPIRRNEYYGEDQEDDEYDDDDYEQDDFVVDEDDVGTQDEVSRTIRSVFGYDKRRCDLREAELDRQYRQIGRVSTFEDLEREERRASRLAAVEDARALREEEERKRIKKIRLKGR